MFHSVIFCTGPKTYGGRATKATRQTESCEGQPSGVLMKLTKEVDNRLADETLSNEAAAHLNVVCEQLERKVKVYSLISMVKS